VLARFRIASEKADTGDNAGAVADYDAIAARNDVPADVRNMARIRAALVLVDTASVADLTKRIGDLAGTGNPWRFNAREILALAAYRAGDFATAKMYFDQVNVDQEAPQDMRDRANVMLSLINPKLAAPTSPVSAPSGATPAPAASAPAAAPPAAPSTPAPSLSVAPPASSAPGPTAPPAPSLTVAPAAPAAEPSPPAAPAAAASPTPAPAAPAPPAPAPASPDRP
jgi:hypothetical protein